MNWERDSTQQAIIQQRIDAERVAAPALISTGQEVRRGGAMRHAYCKDNAGTGQTIQAYLDMDGGPQITVHCHVIGGSTDLQDCFPLLTDGQLVPVYHVGGGWYCFWWFNRGTGCS